MTDFQVLAWLVLLVCTGIAGYALGMIHELDRWRSRTDDALRQMREHEARLGGHDTKER